MAQRVQLTATVSENQLGQRLDQALAEMFPDYSRSRIKEWILDQRVLVNGKVCDKPKEKVLGGEQVAINAEIEEEARFEPQDIPLDIVYEDEDIIIINKPRDLVVHPGAGNPDGTVLNALLHYYPPIADVPRAGIVHRLDKDTTGLMVVAKTVPAQTRLVESLQRREITREYEAVAIGHMTAGGGRANQSPPDQTYPYGGASDGQTSGDSLSHHGTLPCAHASAVASGNWTYAPDPRAYGPYHSSAGGRSGLWWPSASAKRCFGSIYLHAA